MEGRGQARSIGKPPEVRRGVGKERGRVGGGPVEWSSRRRQE
jgi:hypothetical protein